jgi:hypothetical protein
MDDLFALLDEEDDTIVNSQTPPKSVATTPSIENVKYNSSNNDSSTSIKSSSSSTTSTTTTTTTNVDNHNNNTKKSVVPSLRLISSKSKSANNEEEPRAYFLPTDNSNQSNDIEPHTGLHVKNRTMAPHSEKYDFTKKNNDTIFRYYLLKLLFLDRIISKQYNFVSLSNIISFQKVKIILICF